MIAKGNAFQIMIPIMFLFIMWADVEASDLTIILGDLSQSVSESGLSRNISQAEKIIGEAGKGDHVSILGFGRRTSVTLLDAQLPSQAGPLNSLLNSTKKAAIKKFHENMASKIKDVDRNTTDIHGAILRASGLFEDKGKDVKGKRLMLLSDMQDNLNFRLSMKKLKVPGSHRNLWKASRIPLWPNLQGVSVKVFCPREDIKDFTEAESQMALRELKEFWKLYFKQCGAELTSFEVF